MQSVAVRKGRAFIAVGAVGLLLSAGYLGLTAELPFGRMDQPGAAVFPVVAGAILAAASLITMWEGWRLDPGEMVDMPRGADLRRLLALTILLFGFLLALPILGQLISSIVFCALLMRTLSSLTWVRITAYSVVMAVSLYVVFIHLLKVPMPRGLLGY